MLLKTVRNLVGLAASLTLFLGLTSAVSNVEELSGRWNFKVPCSKYWQPELGGRF